MDGTQKRMSYRGRESEELSQLATFGRESLEISRTTTQEEGLRGVLALVACFTATSGHHFTRSTPTKRGDALVLDSSVLEHKRPRAMGSVASPALCE